MKGSFHRTTRRGWLAPLLLLSGWPSSIRTPLPIPDVFESIFEFLFKYRPLLFQEGSIRMGTSGVLPLVVSAAVLMAFGVATYHSARGRSSRTDRIVLGTLRVTALGVLLVSMLRPMLVLSTVVPQRNFVGVLIDDSRSMTLANQDGSRRSDFVTEALAGAEGDLIDRLEERFAVRLFRFSRTAERIDSIGELGYGGTGTDLAAAIAQARTELAGVPLSGLVVVTDGADNSGGSVDEALLPLKAEGVPVYTVGIGEEFLDKDIQVGRVEAPATVLAGSALVVEVVVTQSGFSGQTVPLVVEDDGRVVATQDVELGRTGEPRTVRVRFQTTDPGPRVFRFRVPAQDGEAVPQNNVQELLIVVADRREKLLFLEGEPRPEMKHVRRAVEDDSNIQMVVLQRTAENKFLRLDVDDPDELLAGFPRTREELFQYRALVIGSMEASFFTHDQLQMLADFVSERGGGLLMLGGRNAFVEGGYAGTPVAEALPFELDEADRLGRFADGLAVEPTRAGISHSVTQLDASEEISLERWESLPPLSTFNHVPEARLKPGATLLLRSDFDDGGQVILAYHRFGRGKAAAMPVNDTWMWQMIPPLEDISHETFWRQISRWLVDGVPDRVQASVSVQRVEPGTAVTVRASVDDSAYAEVNGAQVSATVTDPIVEGAGPISLEWTIDRDGEYEGRFVPPEVGLFEIRVDASRGEESLGSDATYVLAAPSDAEYFDAGMRAGLLRHVADETGGRFYTAANASALPEDIRFTGAGVTLVEEQDLWDMPAIFLLLIALIGAEWGYRRARELA